MLVSNRFSTKGFSTTIEIFIEAIGHMFQNIELEVYSFFFRDLCEIY